MLEATLAAWGWAELASPSTMSLESPATALRLLCPRAGIGELREARQTDTHMYTPNTFKVAKVVCVNCGTSFLARKCRIVESSWNLASVIFHMS